VSHNRTDEQDMQDCPVVLVHGWKSHPGIWKNLIPRLSEERILFWSFDHVTMDNSSLEEIAKGLQYYISSLRKKTGYTGFLDIVCHSMGTCIARYLLEVIDGKEKKEKVRQLIGIGPPNNGSAMAELFNHPDHGPKVINTLTGVFVPEGYVPAYDLIVQEFRPGSKTMKTLSRAGLRKDIAYRIIISTNRTQTPALFPQFKGQTPEILPDGTWSLTWEGDGIVTHSDSHLPGAEIVILPRDVENFNQHPDQYSHIKLPRNSETVEQVIRFLKNRPT
jgi:pimeloyl-ACP methyl ester carboxylesterase